MRINSQGIIEIEMVEFKKEISINTILPVELILCILSFLNDPKDIVRIGQVCRVWRVLAADKSLNPQWKTVVGKAVPNFSEIDGEILKQNYDLAKFGLSVDNAAPTHYHTVYRILKELVPKVEGNAGVTILTLPRGLTIMKLLTLTGYTKRSDAFDCSWNAIFEDMDKSPQSKTRKFIITNSILKGSRNKSVEFQQKIVSKLGCAVPALLPSMALCYLTQNLSKKNPPTCLYSGQSPVETIVSDDIELRKAISGGASVFGGSTASGYTFSLSSLKSNSLGVGAMLKLQ